MAQNKTLAARKVVVEGLAKLPAFCHAVVAGDFVYVSGTLGTRPDERKLVPGGVGPETTQALRNIETILHACGGGLQDVVKVNVYVADIVDFEEMNEAYIEVMGADPPARTTVGYNQLAFGANVEIDAVAYIPRG